MKNIQVLLFLCALVHINSIAVAQQWLAKDGVYNSAFNKIYRNAPVSIAAGNDPITHLVVGGNTINENIWVYGRIRMLGQDAGIILNDCQLMNNGGNIGFLTSAGWSLQINKTTGAVGIGTSAPPVGYLLAVKGKIVASEVKVSVAALGDYIFSPAYRLRPLSEVDAYIKQNGHLPEVPTAAEVAREGMNVGEMENTLLKKIEELTLYVIELKKENEQQTREIEQLRTAGKNRR